jgi:hypothetical protein
MIISKSNIISVSGITLNTGALSSGAIANVQNSDFSSLISSSASTLRFSFASVGSAQYVALHGLDVPIGTVVAISATGFTKSYTTTNQTKNLVFYNATPSTFGTLQITLTGAGLKTISYVTAGLASSISWGTNAGQSLHYLGLNEVDRVTSDNKGQPTNRVSEQVSPRLSLTMSNMLKTWARGDLQEIFNHYRTSGVISILDYEGENKPNESVAAFELSKTEPRSHSQTLSLINITLSFKVSV